MEEKNWREWAADYFTFSRKERWAVIVLVLLLVVLVVLPRFIPETSPDLVDEDSLAMAVIKSWQRDSLTTGKSLEKNSERWKRPGYLRTSSQNRSTTFAAGTTLFYFDPNTATPDEWMQLGVKEKTAFTIIRFVERGGRFRTADDLHKIYGLPAALADKLKPYVRIKDLADHTKPGDKTEWTRKRREISKVNLNTADSMAMVALPGIGPRLAARIIGYREKLGGFYRVDQLLEVYGIRDSLLNTLLPYLEPDIGTPNQIDINTVGRVELVKHPYFRGPIANSIINYRDAHGPYQSIADLMKIHLADTGWIKKVEPYCKIR